MKARFGVCAAVLALAASALPQGGLDAQSAPQTITVTSPTLEDGQPVSTVAPRRRLASRTRITSWSTPST